MSQKTRVEDLEVHFEQILGDYLGLAELVKEFQELKNFKDLSQGRYIFNRDMEKKVAVYQKQLAKLSYHGIQIEKLLDE